MTEIRPIYPAEAAPFLELLCSVFGLELDRARSIFLNEPFFDLRRKWAVFEGDQIVSVLTAVPLIFGWGRAIGIAGVATRPDRQREGLAGKLLDKVCEDAKERGETAVYLFAKQPGLYEKHGFEVLDEVIRGPITLSNEDTHSTMLEFDDIRIRYDAWSEGDLSRLRRDEHRWRYWKWNLRVCSPYLDGYLCTEGGMVREAVISGSAPTPWPLPSGIEWFGLASMTDRLEVPLQQRTFDLHFMGRHSPGIPQLFMTDQF